MDVLVGKPTVSSKDFSHGLRRSPPDSSGLIVQVPHETPHDHPGGFQVAVSQLTDNMSHRLDSPPFDLFIAALDERQKGVDDLPRRKAAYVHKGLFQIALIQKIEKLFLESATAVLQLKGPCARDRNREKNLYGKV